MYYDFLDTATATNSAKFFQPLFATISTLGVDKEKLVSYARAHSNYYHYIEQRDVHVFWFDGAYNALFVSPFRAIVFDDVKLDTVQEFVQNYENSKFETVAEFIKHDVEEKSNGDFASNSCYYSIPFESNFSIVDGFDRHFIYLFVDGSFIDVTRTITKKQTFETTTTLFSDMNMEIERFLRIPFKRAQENRFLILDEIIVAKEGKTYTNFKEIVDYALDYYFDDNGEPLYEMYVETTNGLTTYWIDCKDSVLEIRNVENENLSTADRFHIHNHSKWLKLKPFVEGRKTCKERDEEMEYIYNGGY